MERAHRVITAYHEAGHAVMAMANGFRVTEVANDTCVGGNMFVRFDRPRSPLRMQRTRLVIVLAAGAAADYLHWKQECLHASRESQHNDICMGVGDDQSEALEQLRELNETTEFIHYIAVAIWFLQQRDMWKYVESFAEVMQQTSLLNGRSVLDRALAQVPGALTDAMEKTLCAAYL